MRKRTIFITYTIDKQKFKTIYEKNRISSLSMTEIEKKVQSIISNQVPTMLIIVIGLILFCVQNVSAVSKKDTLSVLKGIVVDSSSNQPLQFVTLRIKNTKTGAVSSKNGSFALKLSQGRYILTASMVGYTTYEQEVTIENDTTSLTIALSQKSLSIAEVMVDAEPMGIRIMRRAIAKKQEQSIRLERYNYRLYTKFVASLDSLTSGYSNKTNDTTILAIFESFSKGYFKKSDNFYNEIYQRRQTANIPQQNNVVAFGTNLNIYDDIIDFLGEEIFTPFNPKALDFYNFELEGQFVENDSTIVNKIVVTPKTGQRRLFTGVLYLDDKTNSPLRFEAVPNEAVSLPFSASLKVKQTFSDFNQQNFSYTLPHALSITSSASAKIFWIIAPRGDINIETVAFDYEINKPFNDDVFSNRKVESTETADIFDSTYWNDYIQLPLRSEEELAYNQIRINIEYPDSLVPIGFFEEYLRPINRVIARTGRRPFTDRTDIFKFNRVHGLYLGLGLIHQIGDNLEVLGKIGYGFSDNRYYGQTTAVFFPDAKRQIQIGASVYDILQRRDEPYRVQTALISTVALFAKNDYGDYYYNRGMELFVQFGAGQLQFIRPEYFEHPYSLKLYYKNEDHRTARTNTQFSFFNRNALFRDNPEIADVTQRMVGYELNLNYNSRRRFSRIGMQLKGKFSSPEYLASAVDFQQYEGSFFWKFRTLPLWETTITFHSVFSRGTILPQNYYSLETVASNVAPIGDVYRVMGVKEFYGDRIFAFNVEHNLGEIVPGILRIPNIASFGLEFIATFNAAWTDFGALSMMEVPELRKTTSQTSDRWYYEVGLGINKFLLFLRTDVTVRLSQVNSPRFIITFGNATF